MDSLDNLKKLLALHNKKNKDTEETPKSDAEETPKSDAEETPKSDANQKTFWNKQSWWIPLPIFSILSIVLILLISQIPVSLFYCPEGYTLKHSIAISSAPIEIDSSKYATGQVVHISSNITNTDNKNKKETYLEINRTHFPSKVPGCFVPLEQDKISTFALIKLDKGSSNYTYIPNQPGLYAINIYNSSQQHEFKTIFEVINPVTSTTFIMLIIAGGFFIALVILTFILSLRNKNLNNEKLCEMGKIENCENRKKQLGKTDLFKEEILFFNFLKENYQRGIMEEKYKRLEKKYQRKMADYIEIAGSLRFLFISSLVWSIIFALVFNELEIGTHSPFGLVLRHNLNPEGDKSDIHQNPLIDWVINIGGNWQNNFSSGIVIPVYVIILGLVGGYLRYLHKTASKEKSVSERKKEKITKDEKLKESEKYVKTSDESTENTSSEFLENTFGELSNIFLAPLLAAVVWFIISEGRTDFNIYGMAAVSFSIGLVTTEIIQIIVKFMERIVPSAKST